MLQILMLFHVQSRDDVANLDRSVPKVTRQFQKGKISEQTRSEKPRCQAKDR